MTVFMLRMTVFFVVKDGFIILIDIAKTTSCKN